jgi:hypothetical protein
MWLTLPTETWQIIFAFLIPQYTFGFNKTHLITLPAVCKRFRQIIQQLPLKLDLSCTPAFSNLQADNQSAVLSTLLRRAQCTAVITQQVQDADVQDIAATCPHLLEFECFIAWNVQSKTTTALFRSCPNILHVNFRLCAGRDSTPIQCRLPRLQSFTMQCCDGVTDKTLNDIATSSPGIQTININGCTLSAEAIAPLLKCTRLEYIKFSQINMTSIVRGTPFTILAPEIDGDASILQLKK